VMLNCLLIGCSVIHANVIEIGVQGLTDSQRIAALESRIAAVDSLVASMTTLLNTVSNRQLEQQTTMTELESLVEDAQDDVNTAIAGVQADVTAKQTQVNTAIAIVQHNVTVMRSQVETINTGLLAKRCEQGRAGFVPPDQPTSSNGRRTHTQHITFSRPFFGTPQITVGLTRLDAYQWANVRIWTDVTNPSPSGFDLSATENDDSHNYYVTVDWMACL